MYPTDSTALPENCFSIVKFHASTVGSRIVRSLVSGSTLGLMPFGSIGFPVGPFGCDARIVSGLSGVGPCDSEKTDCHGWVGFSAWFPRPGRVFVHMVPET